MQFSYPTTSRPPVPDFSRDVHCLMGLPFDAVTEEQAVERIREAARGGKRLFLTTPNLNFTVSCINDAAFRDSVVSSNLCTADGVSIVRVARLFGIPIKERVAGADVFDRLVNGTGHRVAVYFFGGPGGAAAQAAERLNADDKPGAHAVGYHTPGFRPVDEMSGPDVADPINASGAEFVVVALGARKGQEWIQRNWPLLRAPVISHLGAVVNFAAGTIERAPRWVQKLGFEWLWRVKEEPALWRRYWDDGRRFLAHLLTAAVPLALYYRWLPRTSETLRCTREATGTGIRLRLAGAAVNGPALQGLREALSQACAQADRVVLDIEGVTHIGSAFIALVQLLDGWQQAQPARMRGIVLQSVPQRLRRVLRWAGAAYVLEPEPAPVFTEPRLRVD